MIWYLVSSLALAGAALLVYLYFWSKGQFEEQEEIKYQMLRDKEPYDSAEE